ncbi:hypothetical protein LSH36_622g01051 [Paralvinella palmiformis]|uniref:Uncharacterized protein n=1 Tax=Paralvinella palmiformis TaxID=53620 RepID=A0AAD9J5X9_9ANNE|nr:hypothetical protein LSH36_622g01051 [Paralvinella palmiformis]
MINNIEYNAGIGLSDHMILSCDLNVLIPPVKENVARYNYHKGDYKSMNNRLAETDWKSDLGGMDTEEAWAHLSAILNDRLTKQVPKSVPKKDGRRKIWMTKRPLQNIERNNELGTSTRNPRTHGLCQSYK